jgi:hypothetical protein
MKTQRIFPLIALFTTKNNKTPKSGRSLFSYLYKFIAILIFAMSIILYSESANAQQLRKIENNAFQKGEYLKYRVYYDSFLTGGVTAGEVEFQIHKESRIIANRSTMHIEVDGKTKGIFNLFFKVRDRYETFLDEEAMAPWLFIRRVNEGGYIIEQDVSFNHYNNTSLFKDIKRNRTNTSSVPPYVQDLLSAIYYFRTIDISNAKEGDGYPVVFTLDDTVYTTKVFYMGKEDLTTAVGTFRCIKIKPMVLTGNVFKDPFPMMIWVTDDENRIPLLARSEILVGSVKFELIRYKGVKNPMRSKLR